MPECPRQEWMDGENRETLFFGVGESIGGLSGCSMKATGSMARVSNASQMNDKANNAILSAFSWCSIVYQENNS